MFGLISHVNLHSPWGWASGSGEGARAEQGQPHGEMGKSTTFQPFTTAVVLPWSPRGRPHPEADGSPTQGCGGKGQGSLVWVGRAALCEARGVHAACLRDHILCDDFYSVRGWQGLKGGERASLFFFLLACQGWKECHQTSLFRVLLRAGVWLSVGRRLAVANTQTLWGRRGSRHSVMVSPPRLTVAVSMVVDLWAVSSYILFISKTSLQWQKDIPRFS